MGCVNQVWLARLLESEADLFGLQPDGLICTVEGDYAAISQQLDQAARRWQAAGWLNGWRNENFTAFLPDSTPVRTGTRRLPPAGPNQPRRAPEWTDPHC
jgi:hypothetical protein